MVGIGYLSRQTGFQVKMRWREAAWTTIVFAAALFTAAEAPFSLAFKTRFQDWQFWTDLCISMIFTLDLIHQIREYKGSKKKRGPRQHPPSRKKKLGTWFGFLIGAIACIPFDILFSFLGLGTTGGYPKFLRVFRLVRVVRLITIFGNLPTINRHIRIVLIFIGSFLLIHFLACFWGHLNPPPSRDLTSYYIECFYWTITTLTTVGYGDITPTSIPARLYTMMVMMGGVAFYGLVIGNITRIFAESARYKEQTREKLSELSAFMRHYHIPERLQTSVFNYYHNLYSQRLSENDQKIISDLPHVLKDELQIYMNIKLVRNLPLFETCSHACLKAVARALENRHFRPGDQIIRAGDIGDEMFLIDNGEVEVISPDDGRTIVQLHDGQFFGEKALLQEAPRTAHVQAVSYCDLHCLPKEQFLSIIKRYPELQQNIERLTSS